MDNKIKKITLVLMLSVSLALTGLFFMSKRSISFESEKLGIKNDQKANDYRQVDPIRILFVGDMMFDRYIRQVSDKKGYDFVFQKVEDLLKGSDLSVGNLEGPITDSKSVSVDSKMGEPKNYIFTFDSRVSGALAKQNVKLVNIGNNHISNFASSGVESTRKYLTQSGVDFFGDPEDENKNFAIKDIKGMKIAFVSYNQFLSGGKQKAINDISFAKNSKVDFIVLYTHWGKEFMTEPEEKTRNLAHEFIDIGADLIIGSHPHVVQSKEEYKGKTIYYSLGNFIFDQYFDPNTQKGLAVQIEIDPTSRKIVLREFSLTMKNNGQTLQN
ncbi:MAG: hypothetical protein ACD_67C00081G0002 [uncultured bacterium]|nr:MAG: hypothetical protein ACD_67C00081G0002 [uncultured bacterium]